MDSLSVINSPTLIGIITNCLELFGAHTHTHTLPGFGLRGGGVVLSMPPHVPGRALGSPPCGVPSGPLWGLGFTPGPCSNVTGADPPFPAPCNERKRIQLGVLMNHQRVHLHVKPDEVLLS